MQQTHFYKVCLRSFAAVDSPSIFLTLNPCGLCAMSKQVRQFSKIRVLFTRFTSETKSVTPIFFCNSETNNFALSDCCKNQKTIYQLENFARTSLSSKIDPYNIESVFQYFTHYWHSPVDRQNRFGNNKKTVNALEREIFKQN